MLSLLPITNAITSYIIQSPCCIAQGGSSLESVSIRIYASIFNNGLLLLGTQGSLEKFSLIK